MSNFELDDEHHGEIWELIEQYEDSIRNNTSCFLDQDAFETLVEYYESKGLFDRALVVVEQGLEQHPFSAILFLKKGTVLFELKHCEAALEALEKAESYDSSEIGIFLMRAEILTFQSKYEEAIEILEGLFSNADNDEVPDIYLQMADVYEDWEKYYEVFDALKACLNEDPENEEALNRINYCMEITEKYEESRAFHEALINEKPYSEFAWFNLACAYKGLGDYDKAIEAYEYVVAINPDSDFVYQDIAELYFKKEEYKKALEALREFENLFDGGDEEIYFLKGQCHEAMKEYKMARYYYKKSLHCNPNYAEAYFRIGETYKGEDNWIQARQFYIKASELDKEEYDFALASAESAQVLNMAEEAIETGEKALQLAPFRFEAYLLMARVFLSVGDAETSMEILDKGISLCKSTIEIKYARCGVIYFKGQKQEAIVQLLMLLAEDPKKHAFMLYMYPEMEEDSTIAELLSDQI
jgi:tetratricopeptide (TPR) repeat protein